MIRLERVSLSDWLLMPDGLVWVFQKLLIYWDFHAQPSQEFTEKGQKKRKYPVSGEGLQIVFTCLI